MTDVSVSDKRGQEVNQGVNYKEGRGDGQKDAKANVFVVDEAPELVEKVVTEDAFNKSDFAHYASVANDNNSDVTN